MLYKRPSSPHWWVRFRVRRIEIRRSTGTEDRALAEDFEKRLRDEAWQQTRLGIQRRTWDDATARWLTEKAAKRSLTRDKEAFAIVAEYLQGAALDEITRVSLAKLRQVIEDGREPATVLRLLSAIRSVLRACVAWGWLTEAPHMNMPKIERTYPRHITPADFERLWRELPPHQRQLARFSIETGQRFTAVAKLQWSAVDMRRHHAYITSGTSKSKKPVALPLNTEAMAVLKAQRGAHDEYVFTDHKGRAPIGSIKTAWRKACVRAKLPDLKWHELRHTWASWHTMNGTPPIVLKELGGWASLAMVERYSHLSASHLAQYAQSGTKTGTATRGAVRKSAKR